MRTVLRCAAFSAVLVPMSAGAQTVVLTESDVLAQLGSASPRVEAARATVDLARAGILAAARWPNPRVTFNREAVAGVSEHMVMVSQALPITGRRRLEIDAAAARVEAAASRADEQVRRVRADLRLAFTDLWAAQERERELVRTRERLSALVRVLAQREDAGDAAGFDRLRADREVVEIEATRAAAAADRARAQAVVGSFLAKPLDGSGVQAVKPAASPVTPPTVDELMARAETSHGQLVALAQDADAATFSEQAAGRRVFPEPELVAGTKSSSAAGGDVGSILSVHVTVPLFDRAQPERATARALARQARADAAVLRQTIRAQIGAWRAALIERRAIAGQHRSSLAAGAEEIERIALVSYDAGEHGILELLDAYRTASAARLRQAELDAAVREAEIELEFVSGWEIP